MPSEVQEDSPRGHQQITCFSRFCFSIRMTVPLSLFPIVSFNPWANTDDKQNLNQNALYEDYTVIWDIKDTVAVGVGGSPEINTKLPHNVLLWFSVIIKVKHQNETKNETRTTAEHSDVSSLSFSGREYGLRDIREWPSSDLECCQEI